MEENAKEKYVSPYLFAIVQAGLGNQEASLSLLKKAVTEHASQVVRVNADPVFYRFRGLPEFAQIVAKIRPK
jgi:hypothetical protein